MKTVVSLLATMLVPVVVLTATIPSNAGHWQAGRSMWRGPAIEVRSTRAAQIPSAAQALGAQPQPVRTPAPLDALSPTLAGTRTPPSRSLPAPVPAPEPRR